MTNEEPRYATPEEILQDPKLSDRQKVERLRRWEYDQREIAVALEEGMSGPEPELLSRIVRALETLDAGRGADHGPPTKQGGSSPA